MRTVIAVLVLSICGPLMAQAPYLVKDINTTGPNSIVSSSPANFVRFGSRVLFSTLPPTGGVGLWSTDGTSNGTQHIVDVKGNYPSRFTPLNGKVLFNLTSDSSGEELWTTDGTASGTHLLADIAAGRESSAPRDRIIDRNQMMFAADDKVHGSEVWITDGTTSGTRLLKDLVPGVLGLDPHSFVFFKNAIYFAAADEGTLWKSDGTESGTVKVKSVWADNLTVTAFGLFFMGRIEGATKEPWVSDGTEAGTHPIGTATIQAIWRDASYATTFRDRVLFVASDAAQVRKLWISDGTVSGTRPVHDLPLPQVYAPDPLITVAGERAFFAADNAFSGTELWQTDGTEAGTTMVRDIVPGTGSSSPHGLVAVGDKVYFAASTSTGAAPALWVTDATSAGTHPVKGSYPTIQGLTFYSVILTNIDGTLFFGGSDGVNGQEPWKSDGSDAGTSMIANVYPESGPWGNPVNLFPAGDWVYFTADDGTPAYSLWRSDGTSAGTLKLDVDAWPPYFAFGHSLLFNGPGGIWTSGGTPEGTKSSETLTKRFPGDSFLSAVLGDKIFASQYFLVGPNFATTAWWAATTASDAPAVSLGINTPYCAANLAGRLISIEGRVTTTDGTLKGTYEIVRLSDSPEPCPVILNGNVFFESRGGSPAVTKVWKTDGTVEGTIVATSFSSGSYADLTAAGRNLFIVIDRKLWVTDGIEPAPHALPAAPTSNLTAVGDRVVFQATDEVNGAELWISDGTVPGTHLVADLYPGPDGSDPVYITNIGGLIYFQANDGLRGRELWLTDGTAAGTRLVADLEPGSDGSSPKDFVRAGNRLFFSAATKAFGRELWAMPLDPSLTIEDIRIAEGDGADVIAHLTATLSSPASSNVTVDFATAGGSATAGVDYDTRSGTLTFAAGETTKSIDIHTRGNTIPETNKTILLTLGNSTGARVAKGTAYVLIEDDDQFADVALALDFSNIKASQVSANASNNGPRAATAVTVATTVTPSLTAYNACVPCAIQPLAPGTSAAAFTFGSPDTQRYLTATATALQRDTQPANNRAAWIAKGSMAMDALYLKPGSQASVWFAVPAGASNISVASSDPMVISVSPVVPTIGANGMASFLAQGLRIGKATLTVLTGTTTISSLDVDVVASGTTPRWPGAIKFFLTKASVAFDQAAHFTIVADGTAPYSGTTATGIVTISSKGHELGRVTLSPTTRVADAPVYLPSLGDNPITIDYAGDANFLPATLTSSVSATIGIPSIKVTSTRTGAGVTIHIRATGSPFAAPTGTLDITAPGTQIYTQATLTTTAPGVAEADVTVIDPGETTHAVHVVYPGDAHYASATQNANTADLRRHAGGR